nr:hypothetical protein [Kibdelosporangium sp. MJ126-NF4]CEL18851.1 hypothetical protein [Kibdelosporangium sp. MJ126-NF4]CTQ95345.1 hypothetical protein [Kibdelosporangium sp. MJ126-NF4]
MPGADWERQVETHARLLAAVADALNGVTELSATKLPDDALGEIGQSFTTLVDQLVTAGNRALAAGVKAMNATTDGVVSSRESLARRESDTGQGSGGIGG